MKKIEFFVILGSTVIVISLLVFWQVLFKPDITILRYLVVSASTRGVKLAAATVSIQVPETFCCHLYFLSEGSPPEIVPTVRGKKLCL